MAVSYKRLYKVLEEKNVTMVELRKAADIAPNTMTRIRKNEEVSLDVLGRICRILHSDFGLFYQVPMDLGVLYPTTDVLPTYVYRGLASANFGPSTAVGLFQSAAGCVMVIITNLIVRKISPENSLF